MAIGDFAKPRTWRSATRFFPDNNSKEIAMSSTLDRRQGWTAPPRPQWLTGFNALGDLMDIRSIVPLDEDSLLAEARRNTGLSDFDWGEYGLTHFRTLIGAIEQEARLNYFGRLLTRSDLLVYLQARLNITEAYRLNPEIEDEVISEPVFILGFGRSGTTILHEVLSQDPQFRSVQRWEALFPVPSPEQAGYLDDPRIARAQGLMDVFNAISPEWKKMHAFGGTLPVEDIEFTYPAFFSEVWPLAYQIGSYERYFNSQDPAYHFHWHRRILKLLQWKFRGRWLLKNPTHLARIPQLLKFYPDAKLIFTHRDPIASADSVVNVEGTIYSWRTDHPYGGDSSADFLMAGERARKWDNVIAWIESGVIKPGSYANFRYHEFMDDPWQTIRNAFSELGLPLSESGLARMKACLDAKPQGAHGRHAYARLAEEDPAKRAERELYRRYQEYFGVPDE